MQIPRTLFTAFFLLCFAPGRAEDILQIARQAEQFMLENGLQVVVIPDRRAPVVTQMIWYKVGSADEHGGHSGIAHFLEHLMFKGTMKYPPGKFSAWLSTVGGQENAFTSNDYTAYFQRAAKGFLPQLMEFEADRMAGLVLNDANVLPEREVVMEERRQRTDQHSEALLGEAMQAALYQNHPYGIPVIGWMHEMQQMTTQDALAFYGRFYTPNNAVLIIAGDVTTSEVRKLAQEIYGKVQRRAEPPPRLRAQEPPPRVERSLIYFDAKLQQPLWARYYLVPSYAGQKKEMAPALELLEEILNGPAGRLYQRLAVEKGIAASASANYDGQMLDSGTFSISVTPKSAADFPAIDREVDSVVQSVADNGVKAEEFARARSSLLARTVYAEDSQVYLARLFGVGLTIGLSFDEIKSFPQKLAAVTSEEVRDAARTWLAKERSVTGYLLQGRINTTPANDVKVK